MSRADLIGPTCPFDGKPALLHFAGLPSHVTWPRSFKEPTPRVKHQYSACADCDDLRSLHFDGIKHCARCGMAPDECDGTPLVGGVVPRHDEWPEGREWWTSILAAARGNVRSAR